MQLMESLHKILEKELPFIHKIRLASLMSISDTATRSNKLSLTGLGSIVNPKVKNIRRPFLRRGSPFFLC